MTSTTGPRGWALAEHRRETLVERAAAGAVLVLPVGAIEQHGPHLPVWTDALIATHVAERAAAALDGTPDVLVAPTFSFGSSDHHLPFGGTLSMRTRTLMDALTDLGRSAVDSGFRRLYLLNGHGGNDEIVQLVARDLALQLPVHAGCSSWWKLVEKQVRGSGLAAAASRIPGHAGAFESAVMQTLRPDLVGDFPAEQPEPESKRQLSRLEMHQAWIRADGYTDSPGSLPAADGAAILRIAVDAVATEIRRFCALADQNSLPTEETRTRD
ncbi:creatininase family protein [Nocardioides sp. LMS-CY]|uniref:creatininase family protein n=1 Tax=Nocardioides sp. (strain LMS-CY) TaxID=2840457 RepID=UPI001C002C41|nr:creatininase family protein [Nocardioides sp. LMS-CY]QWF20528.1 creatininase family protein [Nocardioides sp. LMS-CY]